MLNQSVINYQEVAFEKNTLFYGDNKDILRRSIPSDFVDMIYLDPPFNSQANYNILFKESTGEQSSAQFQAFTDFWKWDKNAGDSYRYLTMESPNSNLGRL